MRVFRWIFVFLLIVGMAPLRLAAQDTKAAQKAVLVLEDGTVFRGRDLGTCAGPPPSTFCLVPYVG